MTSDGICQPPLEFLIEPAFLIRRDTGILTLNTPARRLLGPGAETGSLLDHVASPHDEFRRFLRRAAASTSPIVGAATLRTARGTSRFRLNAAALPGRDGGNALVLRCLSPRDDQFSVLGQRVRDLNDQLRSRLHEKAVLEEALRANQELLRELQHRVKNSIQMMLSLIQMSARGRGSKEVGEFVESASLRLQALSAAQEAIYRSDEPGAVSVRPLLEGLAWAIAESFGADVDLELEIAEARVPGDIAHALCLIVNELATNALRHGLSGRTGVIRIALEPIRNGFELVVQDSGPGMAPDAGPVSSGLKLVRGLCRQIGGALAISNAGGARCSVRFETSREWRPG